MDQKYWGDKGTELIKLWWGNAWNKGGLLLLGGGITALVGWFDKPVRFVLMSIWPNTPQSYLRKRTYFLVVEEFVGSNPKIEITVAFPAPFG